MLNLRKLARKLLGRSESEWALRIARDNARTKRLLPKILKAESNCIDIGSHKGMYLEYFLQLSPRGSHMAIEPLPEYYSYLKQKFPSISIYNIALSDFEGEATFFNVKGSEAMSGLRKQHYPNSVGVLEIKVEVKSLDVLANPTIPISFIKIDVEGAELNVLKGAVKLLARDNPVVLFEFAHLHAQEYGVTSEIMYDFFSDLGYEIFRLDKEFKYSRDDFNQNFIESHGSKYDRNAETNFLAIYPAP
jgi:FkbM family methyltransferase